MLLLALVQAAQVCLLQVSWRIESPSRRRGSALCSRGKRLLPKGNNKKDRIAFQRGAPVELPLPSGSTDSGVHRPAVRWLPVGFAAR